MIFFDILYTLALILLSPWLIWRIVFRHRYRTGWKHRFGFVPKRYTDQPCIWIHAVSVGEVNAAASLIEQLRRVMPQFEIVISTTTDTGFNRANGLYGRSHRVFFYPWDFSFAVKKAFDRIRPQACILMELELWYNFSCIAHTRKIPLIIANGRISSAKGFPRYKKIAPLVRGMFGRLSLVLAQEPMYAERFAFLGTDTGRIKIVGTLKYDTAEITDAVGGADELGEQLQLDPDAPLIVAGSTGPGEEKIILDAFAHVIKEFDQPIRLALIPRKPERFDDVARLIESCHFPLIRYSQIKTNPTSIGNFAGDAVILGDTMGDLRKFYSLAYIVFVGRSLVPMGGSDMIEAAALAKPIVLGPHAENFADTVHKLQQADAVKIVANTQQLTDAFVDLFHHPDLAADLAKRARHVILDNQGATQKTIEAIVDLLNYQMPQNPGGIATPMASQS